MKATHPSSPRGCRLNFTPSFTSPRAPACLLAVCILVILSAASSNAVPIFGINNANNNLVRFESATPGSILSSTAITGMISGDTIVGLDFRPVDGKLFGLGSGSRLYVIDPVTAVATQVGTGTFAVPLNGSAFGFDFNPVVDRIRVVTNARDNFRLDPNTGLIVDGDTATAGTQLDADLAYAAGDPNAMATPNIVSAAYTNNTASATTTTLYGLDSVQNVLVRQGGVNVPPGTPSPNAGTLFTVGSLGVDPTSAPGFDIATGSGTAFATMVVGGVPRLYTIDLNTGAAIAVGTIGPAGTPVTLRAMTVGLSGFDAGVVGGTTATFVGSVGGNTIIFDQSGGLLRHNRFSAGDAGFASDFDFNSSVAGDQTLSATNPAVTIVVNAGDRDDVVIIGTNAAPASGLAAAFQINGQGGGDSLTINDSINATGRTFTVNGASSTVSGLSGPVTYGTLESITINAGSGADTINVTGTAAALTSINAGGGGDTVNFGNGATLSGGLLDGGAGTDLIDYTAYNTPVAVNMNETQSLLLGVLSGMQEPGPLSSSQGSGRGVFLLNAAQTALTFNITFNGITGATINGEGFHNGPAGVSSPPVVRETVPAEKIDETPPDGLTQGVWTSTDAIGIGGVGTSGPLTPALVAELLANRIYFNIRTNLFPSGELRAQLISMGPVGTATGTGGLRGFENVTGGSGGDTLIGNDLINTIRGGPGNDTINSEDDGLPVGSVGDILFGDAGDDTFIWDPGDGSDRVDGGTFVDGNIQIVNRGGGNNIMFVRVDDDLPVPSDALFDGGGFELFLTGVQRLDVLAQGGTDTLTVDFNNGSPFAAPGLTGGAGGPGIFYDGGAQGDRLVLQRSAPNTGFVATNGLHTATGPDAGIITIDGGRTDYVNLAPVDDTVPTTNFTFTATAASSAMNIINGPVISGFNTTQINDAGTGSFELINFANKTNVTVNSGTVSQLINIDNATAATGLASLTVNGGPLDDTINVLALPPGITAAVNGLASSDLVSVTGAGVPAGTTLFLDNGPGFDQLVYDSGGVGIDRTAGPNPGQTTITRPGSGNVVYQNFEDIVFDGIARALNISTRLRVLTADNVLIGGFIIPGSVNKRVIVRAIGPSLGQFGLTGLLADPTLEMYNSLGQLTAANDNWRETQEGEIIATGIAPQNDFESALVTTLSPGAHTVVVRGKDNGTGIGVVEAYDLEANTSAQFANISTRGFVDAGDNVMIGGFILGGDTGSTHVAIRGIGPSLAQAGIANALADPTLDLYDANGTRVIFNDNWMDDSAQAAALSASGLAPSINEESGIFTTLLPGAYTAILAGKNGGIGVGLVEVYNLQ